jgi:hypothetical protein
MYTSRVILYLIVIGVCIGCGILAQTASAFPPFHRKLQSSALWSKLKAHIFLPALFGSRRLEPLPGRVGYLPGRALSIFITIYITLNIIFSAVSFRSFQPNTFFMSKSAELNEYVGNRTGTLSLVNMSMAILFAGRNNILIALTGWSQTTFILLHRWIARVAALQAVVHSICYTLQYTQPGYPDATTYAAKVVEPFYVCASIFTFSTSDRISLIWIVVGNHRHDRNVPGSWLCSSTTSPKLVRVLLDPAHCPRYSYLSRVLVPSGPPLRI